MSGLTGDITLNAKCFSVRLLIVQCSQFMFVCIISITL